MQSASVQVFCWLFVGFGVLLLSMGAVGFGIAGLSALMVLAAFLAAGTAEGSDAVGMLVMPVLSFAMALVPSGLGALLLWRRRVWRCLQCGYMVGR